MRWSFGQSPAFEPDDLRDLDARAEAGGAPADPRADEPDAWDSDEARAFVLRVVGPREALVTPWVAACEGARWTCDRVDAFATRAYRAAATGDRIAPRLACPPWEVPAPVRKGLESNQKPFQLWNVERTEAEPQASPEPVPRLSIGQAALLSEEQRPPRTIEKATRALKELADERDFRRLMDEKQRVQLVSLWRDPLPFGRPDEPSPGEDSGARVISLEELMDMQDRGERFPGAGGPRGPLPRATRVRTGTPPADEDAGEDEGDAPPPRRRPPAGGFSLEQPDDDGEE